MTTPGISLVIPVFNAERFIAEALASVRAQTRQPDEIIIVDDGCSDATIDVARRANDSIRVISQPNRGPGAARNLGVRNASHDFIAFLDADDLWPENALETLERTLATGKDEVVIGLVQCRRLVADAGGAAYVDFAPPMTGVNVAAALFRRTAFEINGPFDAALRQGEDLDWFFRARERGLPIGFLGEVTLYYRLHEENMTRDRVARNAFFIQALKRSIDRRRATDVRIDQFIPKNRSGQDGLK